MTVDVIACSALSEMSVCFISDMQFATTVKNAWKIHDHSKDKWYLLCAKTPTSRDRWLRAFVQERQTVQLDKANGKLNVIAPITTMTVITVIVVAVVVLPLVDFKDHMLYTLQ